MPKPRAFIQREIFLRNGSEIPESDLTVDDIEGDTFERILTPSEVEILFWGNTIFWVDDKTPLVITVAFCREKKSGLCLEVTPTQMTFDKE